MDINGIRRRNYETLMERFKARPEEQGMPVHGLLTRFAKHAGVSVRYLSHINNDRKNIGSSVARQLEAGFNLPIGWLDNDHEAEIESASDTEKEFAATALRLFRESPVDAQAMLMRYMMERINKK